MIVPLTPVRCLYRGVDLYGSKDRDSGLRPAVQLRRVWGAL